MPENADEMQESGKFRKGQSGNPKGKTKGTKNKTTLIAEALLKDEVENICRCLIQEALTGNIQAIKMVLDRVFPFRREYPITIKLPKIQNSSDVLQAIGLITTAVGNGEISPSEGEALSRIIDVHVKAIEAHDYEKRLEKLEERKIQ
jgi:Family of unknown function (DUF5681)